MSAKWAWQNDSRADGSARRVDQIQVARGVQPRHPKGLVAGRRAAQGRAGRGGGSQRQAAESTAGGDRASVAPAACMYVVFVCVCERERERGRERERETQGEREKESERKREKVCAVWRSGTHDSAAGVAQAGRPGFGPAAASTTIGRRAPCWARTRVQLTAAAGVLNRDCSCSQLQQGFSIGTADAGHGSTWAIHAAAADAATRAHCPVGGWPAAAAPPFAASGRGLRPQRGLQLQRQAYSCSGHRDCSCKPLASSCSGGLSVGVAAVGRAAAWSQWQRAQSVRTTSCTRCRTQRDGMQVDQTGWRHLFGAALDPPWEPAARRWEGGVD